MAKLLYQGHGSFRITTNENKVIYVDPFAGRGYDLPGDIILVTHQHMDHNRIKLVTQKPDCTLIQNQDAIKAGVHQTFDVKGVHIQAVPAYNSHHDREESVGYLLTFDGIKLYAAGDTSTTKEMADLTALSLDYALLPTDGIFNMGPVEASACAETIGAKHTIPIHMMPGALFNAKKAEKFSAKNRLIVRAGEEITL